MSFDAPPSVVGGRLAAYCRLYLRPIDHWSGSGTTWDPVFVPPLSAAEQVTFDDLVTLTRFGVTTDISLAEFQALKPALAEIRSFRTRTLAAWNALTATQREADEIAFLNDLTDVLRALLRA